jgi:hypothetical protein
MRKLTSHFLINAQLWKALREHVRGPSGFVQQSPISVGTVGSSCRSKRGDTIIVDMSIGAVR